jgi:hypothetical protein
MAERGGRGVLRAHYREHVRILGVIMRHLTKPNWQARSALDP